MKRFIRTMPGKTTLFLSALLSASLLFGCIVCVWAMAADGFYTRSKEAIQQEYQVFAMRVDLMQILRDAAWADWSGQEQTEVSVEETALRYAVYNWDGKIIQKSATGDFHRDVYPFEYTYVLDADGSGYGGMDDMDSLWNSMDQTERERVERGTAKIYTICAYLDETAEGTMGYPYPMQKWIDMGYNARYGLIALGVAMGFVCIVSYVALMCVSGRRPDTEALVPGPLNRVPSDLLVGACVLASCCVVVTLGNNFYSDDYVLLILGAVTVLAGAALILGLSMSIACRIKQRSLLRNTVIWRLCKLSWRGLKALGRGSKRFGRFFLRNCRQLPMVWRTCLLYAGLCILDLLVLAWTWDEPGAYLFFWFVGHILLAGVVLFGALTLRRLQKAGEALAQGDLSYQVDTHHMYWDFKRHGENLNNIAGGMTQAVELRMKSERMKTELITNVSHDIKTPLTSIINYADLITKEKSDNPKIGEYAEVLGRQSDRLKRLIEDLVEASKASTGNLEVLLAPCEAENFLVQISGEYEKKLADAGLELVTKVPEKPLRVMADGRRMLRVFDNLMNNICKYAQRGTRVYLTLEEQDLMAVITFRNTSRAPLNLSAEELLERFVQGDASRSGEGNGLGLSIARSLTELQNGSFQLDVDGDLFKVTLRFPLLPD